MRPMADNPPGPSRPEAHPRGRPVFLKKFLESPGTVGAIAPSSRFLARKMLSSLEWGDGVRVIEFGPGTGPFTRAILERLPPSGRYLGIERDQDFVDLLEGRFPGGEFVCESVENVESILSKRGLLPVDHVVSGLPFASLGRELIERILDALDVSLRDGGTFSTFQYLHAVGLPSARYFRREMKSRFGRVHSRRVEFRNLPPAFVFSWKKTESR